MTRTTRFTLTAALAGAVLALLAPAAAAQVTEGAQTQRYLELLRQDLRTQKMMIVTEAMPLTDAQAEIFWPIYDEFSAEMRKVWDDRIVNIKDFAENYERMTNDKAKEIADKAFKHEEQRVKIFKKYYDKYSKELNPLLAARFVQIEETIHHLISLQLYAELPLMK